MRKLAAALLLATVAAAPASAGEPGRAPDCRFDGAREYRTFGAIHVVARHGRLYGCHTDVGRARRLDTGTLRARTAAARRPIFGFGDWVGYAARDNAGRQRVRATNLRTGATPGARSPAAATALVVNVDGTIAWIAGNRLYARARGEHRAVLGADAGIDRRFLGVEKDQGCAVTWRVGGEQRSSSIHCTRP
jgi:hypothetical protein